MKSKFQNREKLVECCGSGLFSRETKFEYEFTREENTLLAYKRGTVHLKKNIPNKQKSIVGLELSDSLKEVDQVEPGLFQ